MPPQRNEAGYLFEGFRLDPARGALFAPDGAEVKLRPKPFALLRHMLDNPGRLLGREELLEALWPGVVVTDDSLTQCVSDLRRGFGDRATAILRTVPRRGYQLVAAVRRENTQAVEAAPDPPAEMATQAPMRSLALQRRDGLFVLPATSPPGDEMAARLAPAFISELIGELVRFESLRVVAVPQGGAPTGFTLHTELHAAGDTTRIVIRLEDRITGTSFWADRVEFPARSSALPLNVVTELAGAIELQIGRKSLRRAQQKLPGQRTAQECCLIGRDLHQHGTEADTIAARQMFMQAMEIDPGLAASYAWAAFTLMRVVTFDWSAAQHGGGAEEAVQLARKAVELEPESALCQSALAFALSLVAHWDEAMDTARFALRLSRIADHGTRMACCEVLAAGGAPEEAAVALQETLALDPHCPPRVRAVLGRALLLSDQPEEALRELRRCAARLPDYAPCARTTVVAGMEAGMVDEAITAFRDVARLRPQWLPGGGPIFWFLRRPEDVARFRSAFEMVQRLDAIAAKGGLMNPSTTRF